MSFMKADFTHRKRRSNGYAGALSRGRYWTQRLLRTSAIALAVIATTLTIFVLTLAAGFAAIARAGGDFFTAWIMPGLSPTKPLAVLLLPFGRLSTQNAGGQYMQPIRFDKMFLLTVRNAEGEVVFDNQYLSVTSLFQDLAAAVPAPIDIEQERMIFCLLGEIEIYHDGFVCELRTEEQQWAQA